jgi:hypothetical protein
VASTLAVLAQRRSAVLALSFIPGNLPPAWRDVDASRLASALATFDSTYSGYLDWRSLLLSLAAASLPAIHTGTTAQVAMQALQLAAADGDSDGRLTQQEFEGLQWWFEPHQELHDAAAAAPEHHGDVLHEIARWADSPTNAGADSGCVHGRLATAIMLAEVGQSANEKEPCCYATYSPK